MPETTSQCLDIFCRGLPQATGTQRIGVVLDGSGSHRSKQFTWPSNLGPLRLPAYSPELNPAEQLFRHLRKQLANHWFDSLKELEAALSEELRRWQANRAGIQQLMGYPWWNKGVAILSSIR